MIDFADDFEIKVVVLFVNILKHIVDIWESFDLQIIVDEFVDIELKLPVFGDFVMTPKIRDVLDELFLKLLGFCKKINLEL